MSDREQTETECFTAKMQLGRGGLLRGTVGSASAPGAVVYAAKTVDRPSGPSLLEVLAKDVHELAQVARGIDERAEHLAGRLGVADSTADPSGPRSMPEQQAPGVIGLVGSAVADVRHSLSAIERTLRELERL